jgi:hypothetical protein
VFPTDATTAVGAFGAPPMNVLADGADAADEPTAFLAVTIKV